MNSAGDKTMTTRTAHELAFWASEPQTKSERLLGVDADIAAMRVMMSPNPANVKSTACKLLLAWAENATRV
jgi:hypothetical protein